ncbi:MAG: hypothetical protein JXA03_12335 [Bacteroidales bacterium]|nr:hypothetical protein [Bacteroidales bacterium]
MRFISLLLIVFLLYPSLYKTVHAQKKYAAIVAGYFSHNEFSGRISFDLARSDIFSVWKETYTTWQDLKQAGYNNSEVFVLFDDGHDFDCAVMDSEYNAMANEGLVVTDMPAGQINELNNILSLQIKEEDSFVLHFICLPDSSKNEIQLAALISNRKKNYPMHLFIYLINNTIKKSVIARNRRIVVHFGYEEIIPDFHVDNHPQCYFFHTQTQY